jgi:hypothetical protein
MYAFLSGLPVFWYIVAGIIAGYLLYLYWKHKKATAYKPNIAHGISLGMFTSLRDNPTSGVKD